ncbi:MAG TPA: cell division protein FtsX, partial [Pseudomonas sp.]|nr:cell division protein FtsX [Pseudomonas sp.]
MSAERLPPQTPAPAERVGAAPKKAERKDEGPDFRSLLQAWLESHRSSLVDSLR